MSLVSLPSTHPRGHFWCICPMCGPSVICGTCGNGSCNAGRGEVDGKPCPDCPESWAIRDIVPPEVEALNASPAADALRKEWEAEMDKYSVKPDEDGMIPWSDGPST